MWTRVFIICSCFSYFAKGYPNSWIPSFAFQGVGRRGTWTVGNGFQAGHPWERNRHAIVQDPVKNDDYDLADGFQGDDFAAWVDDDGESAELKNLEYDLYAPPTSTTQTTTPLTSPLTTSFKPIIQASSLAVEMTETPFNDIITTLENVIGESPQLSTESETTTEPTPPPYKTRVREDEWDSVERYFLQKAVAPKSEKPTAKEILNMGPDSMEEKIATLRRSSMFETGRPAPLKILDSSEVTTLKYVTAGTSKPLLANPLKQSQSSNILAGYDQDYSTNASYSSPKYLFTRKPQREAVSKLPPTRDFEVELRAAETIRRKLFQNNEQRTQFLAPVDVVEFRRKYNMEDRDVARLKYDVEDMKLLEPIDLDIPPIKIARKSKDRTIEVLVAVTPKGFTPFTKGVQEIVVTTTRPQRRKNIIQADLNNIKSPFIAGNKFLRAQEEAGEPSFASLADLFPTLPPVRKPQQQNRRVTRLPYYLSEQILTSIKNRRGRGRQVIAPDYSPLPYGIDYRSYDGPKSSFAKLRFQGEVMDQLSTTAKNIIFNVPDSESSDTGRLNEVYRFVGRKSKPRPTTQIVTDVATTIRPDPDGLASVLNFFKSLLSSRTTTSTTKNDILE